MASRGRWNGWDTCTHPQHNNTITNNLIQLPTLTNSYMYMVAATQQFQIMATKCLCIQGLWKPMLDISAVVLENNKKVGRNLCNLVSSSQCMLSSNGRATSVSCHLCTTQQTNEELSSPETFASQKRSNATSSLTKRKSVTVHRPPVSKVCCSQSGQDGYKQKYRLLPVLL